MSTNSNPSPDLRETVYSAYSFIRSVESNKSIAAITLDALIQQHINDLKSGATTAILDAQGQNLGTRASQYDQLTALQNDIDTVVQAVQNAGNDPSTLSDEGIQQS